METGTNAHRSDHRLTPFTPSAAKVPLPPEQLPMDHRRILISPRQHACPGVHHQMAAPDDDLTYTDPYCDYRDTQTQRSYHRDYMHYRGNSCDNSESRDAAAAHGFEDEIPSLLDLPFSCDIPSTSLGTPPMNPRKRRYDGGDYNRDGMPLWNPAHKRQRTHCPVWPSLPQLRPQHQAFLLPHPSQISELPRQGALSPYPTEERSVKLRDSYEKQYPNVMYVNEAMHIMHGSICKRPLLKTPPLKTPLLKAPNELLSPSFSDRGWPPLRSREQYGASSREFSWNNNDRRHLEYSQVPPGLSPQDRTNRYEALKTYQVRNAQSKASTMITQSKTSIVITQSKASTMTTQSKPSTEATQSKASTVITQSKASTMTTQSKPSTVTTQSKAPTVTSQSKAPTVTTQSKAPTVTTQSKASTVTTQSKASTVTTQSKAPTGTSQSKESTVTTQSKAPPVTTQSKASTVTSQTKAPTVTSQSKAPPVNTQSKASTEAGQSKASVVTTQSKAPPVTTQSKAPTVTTQSKASTVTTQSKASTVTTQSKAPTGTSQSKEPTVTTQTKASTVTSQTKAPTVTSQSKAPPVTTQSKASTEAAQSKASVVTTQSKAPPVTTQSKASTVTSQTKAPTVTSQSKAPPVTTQSKASTEAAQSRASVVTTQSKAPPVTTQSKAPTGTTQSKAPPVTTQSKASTVTSQTKAPTVTSQSKAPPVTTQSKASTVTSQTKAPTVTTQSKAPTVTTQSKASVVTSQSKAPTVTTQSKAPTGTTQTKAPTVTSQTKAPTVTSQSKQSTVTSQSKASTEAAQSKASVVTTQSKAPTVTSQSKPSTVTTQSKPSTVTTQSKPATVTTQSKPSTVTTQSKASTVTTQSKASTVTTQSKPSTEANQSKTPTMTTQTKASTVTTQTKAPTVTTQSKASTVTTQSKPSTGTTQSKSSTVTTQSKAPTGTSQSKPSTVTTQPKPSTVTTQPKPSTVTTQTKPSTVTTQPKPSAVTTPTKPSTVTTQTKPSTVTTQTKPSTVTTQAKSSTVTTQSKPSTVTTQSKSSTVTTQTKASTVTTQSKPSTVTTHSTAEPVLTTGSKVKSKPPSVTMNSKEAVVTTLTCSMESTPQTATAQAKVSAGNTKLKSPTVLSQIETALQTTLSKPTAISAQTIPIPSKSKLAGNKSPNAKQSPPKAGSSHGKDSAPVPLISLPHPNKPSITPGKGLVTPMSHQSAEKTPAKRSFEEAFLELSRSNFKETFGQPDFEKKQKTSTFLKTKHNLSSGKKTTLVKTGNQKCSTRVKSSPKQKIIYTIKDLPSAAVDDSGFQFEHSGPVKTMHVFSGTSRTQWWCGKTRASSPVNHYPGLLLTQNEMTILSTLNANNMQPWKNTITALTREGDPTATEQGTAFSADTYLLRPGPPLPQKTSNQTTSPNYQFSTPSTSDSKKPCCPVAPSISKDCKQSAPSLSTEIIDMKTMKKSQICHTYHMSEVQTCCPEEDLHEFLHSDIRTQLQVVLLASQQLLLQKHIFVAHMTMAELNGLDWVLGKLSTLRAESSTTDVGESSKSAQSMMWRFVLSERDAISALNAYVPGVLVKAIMTSRGLLPPKVNKLKHKNPIPVKLDASCTRLFSCEEVKVKEHVVPFFTLLPEGNASTVPKKEQTESESPVLELTEKPVNVKYLSAPWMKTLCAYREAVGEHRDKLVQRLQAILARPLEVNIQASDALLKLIRGTNGDICFEVKRQAEKCRAEMIRFGDLANALSVYMYIESLTRRFQLQQFLRADSFMARAVYTLRFVNLNNIPVDQWAAFLLEMMKRSRHARRLSDQLPPTKQEVNAVADERPESRDTGSSSKSASAGSSLEDRLSSPEGQSRPIPVTLLTVSECSGSGDVWKEEWPVWDPELTPAPTEHKDVGTIPVLVTQRRDDSSVLQAETDVKLTTIDSAVSKTEVTQSTSLQTEVSQTLPATHSFSKTGDEILDKPTSLNEAHSLRNAPSPSEVLRYMERVKRKRLLGKAPRSSRTPPLGNGQPASKEYAPLSKESLPGNAPQLTEKPSHSGVPTGTAANHSGLLPNQRTDPITSALNVPISSAVTAIRPYLPVYTRAMALAALPRILYAMQVMQQQVLTTICPRMPGASVRLVPSIGGVPHQTVRPAGHLPMSGVHATVGSWVPQLVARSLPPEGFPPQFGMHWPLNMNTTAHTVQQSLWNQPSAGLAMQSGEYTSMYQTSMYSAMYHHSIADLPLRQDAVNQQLLADVTSREAGMGHQFNAGLAMRQTSQNAGMYQSDAGSQILNSDSLASSVSQTNSDINRSATSVPSTSSSSSRHNSSGCTPNADEAKLLAQAQPATNIKVLTPVPLSPETVDTPSPDLIALPPAAHKQPSPNVTAMSPFPSKLTPALSDVQQGSPASRIHQQSSPCPELQTSPCISFDFAPRFATALSQTPRSSPFQKTSEQERSTTVPCRLMTPHTITPLMSLSSEQERSSTVPGGLMASLPNTPCMNLKPSVPQGEAAPVLLNFVPKPRSALKVVPLTDLRNVPEPPTPKRARDILRESLETKTIDWKKVSRELEEKYRRRMDPVVEECPSEVEVNSPQDSGNAQELLTLDNLPIDLNFKIEIKVNSPYIQPFIGDEDLESSSIPQPVMYNREKRTNRLRHRDWLSKCRALRQRSQDHGRRYQHSQALRSRLLKLYRKLTLTVCPLCAVASPLYHVIP